MRVLIAAGGTAGHINPALAIAGALKKADPTAEIHFAGRKEGMEYRLVTQAGYPFHHIEITGFQRKLSLHNIKRNLITLWNLALSGPKAKAMMKEVKPDLVIGCGGYVSGPVVRCAAKMGIHTAIHEQNAFPGVTNKLLAPDVDLVFAAVPAAVEKLGAPDKTIVVGNPVRPEVFTKAKDRDAIRAELGAGDRTVILSFGGSLGARRVNEVVADLCAWEQHEKKPVLHLHATGQYGVQLFKDLEKEKNFAEGDGLVVKEYINNMPELLAAADLVISRAGALTLAELEAVGRATHVSRAYIFENNADNTRCSNTFEWCREGVTPEKENLRDVDLTGDFADWFDRFDERGVFYCQDISVLPPALRDFLARQGIRSTLQCGIREDGVDRGFLGFDDCESDRLWTREETEDHVVLNRRGRPYSPNALSLAFTRFIRKNALPRITLHGLRHSFATIACHQGASLFDIGKALGHSTPSTTGRIYTHMVDRTHENTVLRVSDALKQTGEKFLETPCF